MKQVSVDILDQADAFEDKLNWQLFKIEQERVLYGGTEDEWHPGEPMYIKPYIDRFGENMVGGNFPRPMVQLMDSNYFHNNDVPFTLYIRCQDCEVYWRGDEGCFVCGQDSDDPIEMSLKEVMGYVERRERHSSILTIGDWLRGQLEANLAQEVDRQLVHGDEVGVDNRVEEVYDEATSAWRAYVNAPSDVPRYIFYSRVVRHGFVGEDFGAHVEPAGPARVNGILIPDTYETEPAIPLPVMPEINWAERVRKWRRSWPGGFVVRPAWSRRREDA